MPIKHHSRFRAVLSTLLFHFQQITKLKDLPHTVMGKP